MILVCGTKRSGTSMWMQIMEAAGLSVIGEKYLGIWEDSIKNANNKGFYESRLRQGVFFASNPHPESGQFMFPAQVEDHALKVFIPGLVRTDISYITAVVATLRHWTEYANSIERLYEMEDSYLLEQKGQERVEKAQKSRGSLPREVEWWLENYDLLRDVMTRKYPTKYITYDRALSAPDENIVPIIRWLNKVRAQANLRLKNRVEMKNRAELPKLDEEKAAAIVTKTMRTQKRPKLETPLPSHITTFFDEYYDLFNQMKPLTKPFIDKVNQVQKEITAEYGTISRDRMRQEAPSENIHS